MSTLSFDTLKYANALKAGGVPSAQAEAEAAALSEVLEVNFEELVTKQDLAIALAPLWTELAVLKWMTGFGLAGIASILLLLLKARL
ncbi:MAG: hypothetical protein PHT88_04870 [Candidatus Moranbacteria bacterium]|nr:hypothetical protein [Candidatus Moranbacteria bacterium]